jgi:type IV fimbrial biogenesis protein FimT
MLMNVKGFTIVELLVVFSIAALLVTVAVPSMNYLVSSNRLIASINALVSNLQFARSEAVKRSSIITLCISSTGAQCVNSGDWEQGWIVFIDADADGSVDAGVDTILRVQSAMRGNITIRGDANVTNRISFNNRGFATGFNGTVTFCNEYGATEARGIVTSNLGRVSRTTDSNQDEIEEDAGGTNLSCP